MTSVVLVIVPSLIFLAVTGHGRRVHSLDKDWSGADRDARRGIPTKNVGGIRTTAKPSWPAGVTGHRRANIFANTLLAVNTAPFSRQRLGLRRPTRFASSQMQDEGTFDTIEEEFLTAGSYAGKDIDTGFDSKALEMLVEEQDGRLSSSDMSGGLTKGAFGAEGIEIKAGSRTIIAGADVKQMKYRRLKDGWTIDDSLDEMEGLCNTSGLLVIGRMSQNMQHPDASTYFGKGKVEEMAKLVEELHFDTLVVDEELSAGQQRNLMAAFGGKVQVIDRTTLILYIFAQRAKSKEARLQVAAAEMKYMLPRLESFLTTGAGMDAKGGGKSGGKYLKGAGETQLEIDRRLFRTRIARIEADIKECEEKRDQYRRKRRQATAPIIAIIGYTNAGKSTLLNTLIGKCEIYADDKLFATLDTTSRGVRLPGGCDVIMTDTVGFIQKLPTKLVNSFKATLNEAMDSTIIVHVVDAASKYALQQVKSVQHILTDLGVSDTPQLLVLNKYDLVASTPEVREMVSNAEWTALSPDCRPRRVIASSAQDGRGIDNLLAEIDATLREMKVKIDCMLPYSETKLAAEVHEQGTPELEEYGEDGVRLVAHVWPALAGRIKKAATAFRSEKPTLKNPTLEKV